jgi:hypothetical protein
LNTTLFADDQAIFSESETGLQRAVNRFENIANGFIMRTSTMKIKTLGILGEKTHKSETVIDNKTLG